MIDYGEKELCDFIEHSDQKVWNNSEIGILSDANLQKIRDNCCLTSELVLNKNNMEENVHIDHGNHDSTLTKIALSESQNKKNKNANPKLSLNKKHGRPKLQKTSSRDNNLQLYVADYPKRKARGVISFKLGSMNSIVGALNHSAGNSVISWIQNYW